MPPRELPLETLIAKGAALVREYLGTHDTDTLKDLAEVILDIRARFTTPTGEPDWLAHSYACRQAIGRVYHPEGFPKGAFGPAMQSALRFHISNRIRERVDEEERETLKLKEKSAAAQRADAFRQTRADAAEFRTRNWGAQSDPKELAMAAERILRKITPKAIRATPTADVGATRKALAGAEARAAELQALIRPGAKPRPKR